MMKEVRREGTQEGGRITVEEVEKKNWTVVMMKE